MKTFSKTDIGMIREVNQDYVYVSDLPVGKLPNLFIVVSLCQTFLTKPSH